mmetsp:Transcript_11552/g.34040  ORF Transcript_11552/g.34040 Transcript_11552/m.34040 type:complete len:313 (-) Transcript_11552:248-1186(-)
MRVAETVTGIFILIELVSTAYAFSPSPSLLTKTNGHYSQSDGQTRLGVSRQICSFDPSDFPSTEWPYTAADMGRLDESDDSRFYDSPRFVTHIDDRAIESLTAFYSEEIRAASKEKGGEEVDILDLCSSWISHLPTESDCPVGKIIGVGMNEKELAANKQLTGYFVQDLNESPSLSQCADSSFDIVCNVVSVDYLTKPQEVFKEMYRVLRPGGIALISFSNRCFPTKAVAMWLQADDIGRMAIVGSYYHYSGEWESVEALDVKLPILESPERPSVSEIMKNPSAAFAWASTASAVAKANGSMDPMFVVKGAK